MNDHDLAAALWTIHRERTLLHDAAAVRDQLLRIPRETPQRRAWWPSPGIGSLRTGLSLARFALAGVTVALFAGLLLTGTMTQRRDDEPLRGAVRQPRPRRHLRPSRPARPTKPPQTLVAKTDLLPGATLITEEVEPGVFRVVNDGVRDLVWPVEEEGMHAHRIVPGLDGSEWLFGPQQLYRIGDPWAFGSLPDQDWRPIPWWDRTGRLGCGWAEGCKPSTAGRGIWFDAGAGSGAPESKGYIDAIDAAADGTLWAAWRRRPSQRGQDVRRRQDCVSR